MYLLLLLVGSIGFLAMTLLGFMHGGGAHLHHATVGHAPSAGHGGVHVPRASHSQPGGRSAKGKNLPSWLMISPLDIFALSLGAGATGEIFQHMISLALLPWIALVCAIAFNLGIVKPIMAFMMKFVSKPSEGLEGAIAKTAEAVTRFDATGKGLVKINLDDQVVQLLATLDDAELQKGITVNKGDEVVVVEVDSAKNTCRVSKDL